MDSDFGGTGIIRKPVHLARGVAASEISETCARARDARRHQMRMRLKSRKTLTAAAAVTLLAAGPALAAPGAALAAPGAALAAPGAAPGTQVTGTLANGTVWIAEYPKSWNGTLILYSHGFGPLTAG